MKLVREHINEKFTEDSDPIKDMGIGTMNRILQELKDRNIPREHVEITDNYFITWNGPRYTQPDDFKNLQLKYMSPNQKALATSILANTSKNYTSNEQKFSEDIKDALEHMTPEEVKEVINEFGTDQKRKRLPVLLSKYTRTEEQIQFDEENNIYVFIGYDEKIPKVIDGETYYKNRLQAEKMVKIDKFNFADLASIEAMKMRASMSGGKHDKNMAVYMVHIPKFLMDEDYYSEIPEQHRYLIEKYKKKI